MDVLLTRYKKYREYWVSHLILLPALESDWEKLNVYYKATDTSPIYTAAVFLDPT